MNRQAIQSSTVGVNLGSLIEHLGPLNNRWREGKPAEKVLTLWDMGDVVLRSVSDPADALLWEIQKRSYITRSVLRYALIVRRGWKHRKTLEELVPDLHNYTVFREALPFLKGNREGIDDSTYREVISCLSIPNTRDAIQYIKELKAQKIGRRHQKGVSMAAIRDEAENFRRAFERLENNAAADSVVELQLPAETLVALSQLAMAVAMGEAVKNIPPSLSDAKSYLPELAGPLIIMAQSGRDELAAFRKVIGAERLMQAADLLNSMRTGETLAEWCRRRSAKLSIG